MSKKVRVRESGLSGISAGDDALLGAAAGPLTGDLSTSLEANQQNSICVLQDKSSLTSLRRMIARTTQTQRLTRAARVQSQSWTLTPSRQQA